MKDTEFSLKLTGTGLSIDQKVSKELATRIMMLVLTDGKSGGETDLSGGVFGSVTDEEPLRKFANPGKASLREYLNQHEAKKITQQIAAIGAYYQAKSNQEFFTRAELGKGFQEAKVQPPANPPRDIGRTIARGWISPVSGQKNQFYVTDTGESAIAANFEKHTRDGAGDRRRKRRNKKTAKKATK